MVISFYGENCFKIQSGELAVLIDPVNSKSGLTAPRFKHDILIKTLSDFPPTTESEDEVKAIYGPGEYNIKDVSVYGYLAENETSDKMIKTVYTVEIEDIKLCFLGHLSEMPSPTVMEHLEDIDILFIPAGGEPFMDEKKAAKLIRQLTPKIVIPTFYKVPGLTRKADDLKEFMEEIGESKIEPQEKLTVKKKDLASIKPSQLVVLKI